MSSCKNCNKTENKVSREKNTNLNACMLKMQDGRSFTDYRPRCTVMYQMKNGNTQNSYDSRMFLIENAEKLMNTNRDIVEKTNNCAGCFKKNEVGTMLPERNFEKCNKHTCERELDVNPQGLGTGRYYELN